jgi:hypothetical protein
MVIELAQIVEAEADVGIVGVERLLADRQRALEKSTWD